MQGVGGKEMRIRLKEGKTLSQVQCVCGRVALLYVWSWGGHGVAICSSCGHRMTYREREAYCTDLSRTSLAYRRRSLSHD